MPEGTGSTRGQPSRDPAEDILGRVLALPEAEQADALETACRENPELATELRTRFEFLRDAGMIETASAREFPERLGDFRLLSKLGGGGMGVVYLATQEALGRTVAVKLMRPEQMFFPGARERFRREYQAIAKLQHPGIVPIYTVGEAEGIPYFAMERVEGRTLAEVLEYLRGLAPEALTGSDLAEAVGAATDAPAFRGTYVEIGLRIAKQVAEALAHAHGRGILHRDVKPSNVMFSAEGRASLLDFGLTSSAGKERITRTGSQVGTLLYMSPEQLRSEREGLDERTDVYSLGVTLYELLTLQPPYVGADPLATQRQILEGRPHAIAARNRRVSTEAAAVCLKAMEVERSARYQSAADFAADLENVLALRPVVARPPGPWLRARRFVQRRPAFSAALFLAGLLVCGVPTALWIQARSHAREIEKQREREHVENQVAAQSLAFLEGLLQGANPYKQGGRDAKVVDLLAAGEERVRGDSSLLPAVRFRLLTNLGLVRSNLGDYGRAIELLEEALAIAERESGEESQPYFRALSMLADARGGKGEHERAIELKKRAVAIAANVYGANSREAWTERDGLGGLLLKADQFAEAADLLREVVEHDRATSTPDCDRAAALADLANAEAKLGRFPEAEGHFAEALAIQRRVLPESHPDLAVAQFTFAAFLRKQGKIAEAEPVYAECRERFTRVFGARSREMGFWFVSYGGLLEAKRDRAGALAAYEEAVQILEAVLGSDHPNTKTAREKRDQVR